MMLSMCCCIEYTEINSQSYIYLSLQIRYHFGWKMEDSVKYFVPIFNMFYYLFPLLTDEVVAPNIGLCNSIGLLISSLRNQIQFSRLFDLCNCQARKVVHYLLTILYNHCYY